MGDNLKALESMAGYLNRVLEHVKKECKAFSRQAQGIYTLNV
jgi:hypothetical protein